MGSLAKATGCSVNYMQNYDLDAQWSNLLQKFATEESEHSFELASPYVIGVTHLSKLLKTTDIVKFRAIELYARYLKVFTKRMTTYFSVDTNTTELKTFYTRFESQIQLRMVTCILIASKLHADTQLKALTAEKVKNFLTSQGFTYSNQQVVRSEMRVLEALDYRCHWPMLSDLVEQLLAMIGLEDECFLRTHRCSMLLIEFGYTDLDNIRLEFSARVKKRSKGGICEKISAPLLGAAIVSAAMFIIAKETKRVYNKIVAKIAKLPEDDVHILAILILDLLNTDESQEHQQETPS